MGNSTVKQNYFNVSVLQYCLLICYVTVCRYVDFVNVMAYDFHFYKSYLPLTGANAPLFPLSSEKGYFATLNTNWSSSYWVLRGMPQEKVIVGLPTYGHSFT